MDVLLEPITRWELPLLGRQQGQCGLERIDAEVPTLGKTQFVRVAHLEVIADLEPTDRAPFEIAGQIAALDIASDGRAFLGLARGTWLGEVGIEQPRPITVLREAHEVISRLLAKDDRGFEGVHFRLARGAHLRYDPVRPDPPLLIGTWGPRTAALAGEIADEVKIGGSANPAMVEVMRTRIGVGTDRASRDVDDVRIVVGAVTVVDHDGEAARARARTEVAMYLAVVAELDPTVEVPSKLIEQVRELVGLGDHGSAGELIEDDLLDRFAFAGTPDQVAEHAVELIEAGAGRVEFGTPHGLTDEGGVRLLAEEVLPRIRERRPGEPDA